MLARGTPRFRAEVQNCTTRDPVAKRDTLDETHDYSKLSSRNKSKSGRIDGADYPDLDSRNTLKIERVAFAQI